MYIYLAALDLISKNSVPHAKDNIIEVVITTFFVILGALAFLMLVIAGFRYILARGNPEKMTYAKNMITYSLTGIVIAILASTIVNVIIGRLK